MQCALARLVRFSTWDRRRGHAVAETAGGASTAAYSRRVCILLMSLPCVLRGPVLSFSELSENSALTSVAFLRGRPLNLFRSPSLESAQMKLRIFLAVISTMTEMQTLTAVTKEECLLVRIRKPGVDVEMQLKIRGGLCGDSEKDQPG